MLNALYVWGVARATGGRVLLRVEDHDRERSRPAYEAALLEDLEWLGFVPDHPPLAAFRAGPCEGRQRDRDRHYRTALDQLRAAGLVYACDCTRAAIAAVGPLGAGGEHRYPGTCAMRHVPETGRTGLRVQVPDATVDLHDLLQGPQSQRPCDQCGDLLVRDRRGNWTYQFVAAVDDLLTGVTLVIRGTDLLASTGRQVLLGRLLGREQPAAFLHHGLIMQTPTQKLSKSDGATGVRDLRALGWTPARVIGEAARLGGLLDYSQDVQASDAAGLVAPD